MTTAEQIHYAMWLSRVGLLRSGAIKQSCIASAKITTEVLRSLGIPARPMTASVIAMTEGWVDCLERGEKPGIDKLTDWWEEHQAWSVGVAYDPEPHPGAFTAHMIVLAGPQSGFLVDPSLDQLARPKRGLPLHPVSFDTSEAPHVNQHEFRRGRTQAIAYWKDDDGGPSIVTVWSCFPADRSFRELPDWVEFDYRYGEMTRSIVGSIKTMIEEGLTGDSLPPLPPLPDAPDGPGLRATAKTDEEKKRLRMVAPK